MQNYKPLANPGDSLFLISIFNYKNLGAYSVKKRRIRI